VITVVPLSIIAAEPIEALLDAAFGTDRHMRTAYRLRKGARAIDALSFAALDCGDLVGTLQSWPVALVDASGEATALVMVGPVAVAPDRQRSGVGQVLMTHMLEAANAGGANALMMIGDPEYYGRFFGFTADVTGGWALPGPVERHRLLARISGTARIPAVGQIVPAAQRLVTSVTR
jgi:predicted N-acetyltransferase YhbS